MGKQTVGSMPLADMQAAPLDIEIRGRTIQINPVPLREWGRFDRWLREETMRMALRAADDAGSMNRGMYIREAVAAATGISIASPEALKGMLGSIEGMLRLAFASLRIEGNDALAEDPKRGLTAEDVEAFVGNSLAALAEIVNHVVRLSFPSEEEPSDPPANAAEADAPAAPAQ